MYVYGPVRGGAPHSLSAESIRPSIVRRRLAGRAADA